MDRQWNSPQNTVGRQPQNPLQRMGSPNPTQGGMFGGQKSGGLRTFGNPGGGMFGQQQSPVKPGAQNPRMNFQGQGQELTNFMGTLNPILNGFGPGGSMWGTQNNGMTPQYRDTPFSGNSRVQDYMQGSQAAGTQQVRSLGQQMAGAMQGLTRRGQGVAGGVDPRSAMMAQGMNSVAQGAADRFGNAMQWGAEDSDRFNQFQLEKAGLANQLYGTQAGLYGNAIQGGLGALQLRKAYADSDLQDTYNRANEARTQEKFDWDQELAKDQYHDTLAKRARDDSLYSGLRQAYNQSRAGGVRSGMGSYSQGGTGAQAMDFMSMVGLRPSYSDQLPGRGIGTPAALL
jgi:hypothetical protein